MVNYKSNSFELSVNKANIKFSEYFQADKSY